MGTGGAGTKSEGTGGSPFRRVTCRTLSPCCPDPASLPCVVKTKDLECRRHDRCRGLAAKALVSIKLVPSSHISLIYFMLPRRRMRHFDSAHAEFCQWWSEMEDSAMTDVAYVTFVCEHRCSKGSIALRSHYQLVHQFFTEHRSSSEMPFFLGTLFCHEGSA